MKRFFQGGFDRNSVALRTITHSGHPTRAHFSTPIGPSATPTHANFSAPLGPSFRPKRPTALSWAAQWRNPLLYPYLPPSHNRVVTVARPASSRHRGRPKIYFKKEENLRRRKSVRQTPRFTTQFTTTSPRFTIKKHHKNSKTPCKNDPPPQKHFFPIHNPKTPPVRLDPCGSSSPFYSSAPLPPWRRTLPRPLL